MKQLAAIVTLLAFFWIGTPLVANADVATDILAGVVVHGRYLTKEVVYVCDRTLTDLRASGPTAFFDLLCFGAASSASGALPNGDTVILYGADSFVMRGDHTGAGVVIAVTIPASQHPSGLEVRFTDGFLFSRWGVLYLRTSLQGGPKFEEAIVAVRGLLRPPR